MMGRIFAGLFLCSLFIVVGGDAQNRTPVGKETVQAKINAKPVWTLEFIRVAPDKFGGAMAYLDDNWMRLRAEAEKEGAVLDYHRIKNALSLTLGRKMGDPDSLVLMTEYKNLNAYEEREKLFASIRERLPKSTPGVLKPQGLRPEDVYEVVDSQVFFDEPEVTGGFKLIAKK